MSLDNLKLQACDINNKKNNLLIDFTNKDDASVFKINDQEALVQSLDFISPMVEDPYVYGKIAAANSLSNIFAMGGDVKTALNVLVLDKSDPDKNILDAILRGGNEKVKECGGVLMGGKTQRGAELFYGLSATGMIHPKKIYRNNTAKIGHVLVLTKPLGMGILTTAMQQSLLDETVIQDASTIMESLNHLPSHIMKKYDVSACTSVGSLGLLGHALQATNPFTSYNIRCGEVPVAPLAQELADKGVVPHKTKENMRDIEHYLTIMCNTNKCKLMYCDTQISGGLLIAMDKEDAKEYVKELEELSYGYASIIGEVIPRGITPLIVY